jgi:hypothetical protein
MDPNTQHRLALAQLEQLAQVRPIERALELLYYLRDEVELRIEELETEYNKDEQ